jgi:phosphatidylglycerol:prolipoprotein diacylglycerol transferase
MIEIINIGIDPVLVRLGPLAVHWYGVMYVIGIVAGLAVAMPYAARLGIDRDAAYEVFWPVLVASLIGGRLYYVVQSDFGWYLRHPTQILATWEGGMAFYGAVFLGTPVAWWVCRRKGIDFPRVLDAAALFIPLAQAIGRIGNLINGDIVGYPSSLPWATRYTNPHNTFVASHAVAYQPAAAYELLFSLALFVLLWRLRYRFRVPGSLFTLWLVLYSVGQFFLFFGRANIVVLADLKQAQLTAIAVVLVSAPAYALWRGGYLRRHPEDGDATGAAPVRLDPAISPSEQRAGSSRP